MGRDIGTALEDLSPFDFEAVRPRLNISFDKDEKVRKAEDRQMFLTTYSFKKGIQKFKRAGFESATSKMRQLHDRDCWDVVDPAGLKETEVKKALESLIFLSITNQ